MILELAPKLLDRANRAAAEQALTLEQFVEKAVTEACLDTEQRHTERLKTALEQLLAETRRAMSPIQRWLWINRMHQLGVWPADPSGPPARPRRLGSRVRVLTKSAGEGP